MVALGFFLTYDGLTSSATTGTTSRTTGISTSVVISTSGSNTFTTTTTFTYLQPSDTTTTLNCVPGIVGPNAPSTCTATVTPGTTTSTLYNPTGTISFTSTGSGFSLLSTSCEISGSGCSVQVKASGTGAGGTIKATYGGSSYDNPSSGVFQLGVLSQNTVNIVVTPPPAGALPQQPFSFAATSACPYAIYTWDFGDGSLGQGGGVTHTYSTGGVYTVTVTAMGSGCYGSNARTVTVASYSITQLVVTVLTANTNAPIQGATVSVLGNPSQTTNSMGQAVFAVQQGQYSVTVNAPGFAQSVQTVTVPASGLQLTIFMNLPVCFTACPQSIFGAGAGAVASEIIVGLVLIIGGSAGFLLTGRRQKPGL